MPRLPLLFTGLLFATAAQAHDPGRHRGPPPAALEACAELQSGDTCTVDTPEGERSGSCLVPPKDDDAPLACVPEGAPRPGEPGAPGGPPPR